MSVYDNSILISNLRFGLFVIYKEAKALLLRYIGGQPFKPITVCAQDGSGGGGVCHSVHMGVKDHVVGSAFSSHS